MMRLAALISLFVLAALPAAAQPCDEWEVVAGERPVVRLGHAVAFDSHRNVLVLFGGRDSRYTTSPSSRETWEWDGARWTLRAVDGPPPRSDHDMVFDAARGRVVLFGGIERPTIYDDTWEWDGAAWRLVAEGGPEPRYGHAMAYDAARGVTVMFGDRDGREGHDPPQHPTTWEWDGVEWSLRASTGPVPKGFPAMAYDTARGVTVMFGGYSRCDPPPGGHTCCWTCHPDSETWEWDGAAWTLRSTTAPGQRVRHAMVYDTHRDRIVLYGGFARSGGGFGTDQTWAWDGSEWTSISSGAPGRRHSHAMGFDTARGVITLFGGGTDGASEGEETWEFDAGAWTLRDRPFPRARYMHAMAHDTRRGVTVMFSGDEYSTDFLDDTVEWDGETWSLAATGGPQPRIWHAMAYDEARGETVLFGGVNFQWLPETWTWDGEAWDMRAPAGPQVRSGPAMAYDAGRERVVLFGGDTLTGRAGDTWEWDGAAWTLRSTSGPSPRWRAAMVYDTVRQRILLYGGRGFPGAMTDTWEWDGAEWTLLATTGPSLDWHPAMVFDSRRGMAILLGSAEGTWAWDGDAWNLLTSSGPALSRHAMAYDSARGATVAFGGQLGTVQSRTLELGPPCCYADCDGSGALDFFDFLCFQNLFAAGDPEADCDASGELDFFDFLCFQNAFAAGCQ